jgi:hypothetical protein
VAAWIVVGHQLTAPYGLKPLDLWPRPAAGALVGVAAARALRSCPFDRSAIAHLVKYYAPA